ncbi:chalcone-flavanone isomerase-domain-containing protein [Cryomyces antarcticus]|nr:hypothetical protein LTR04_006936 [Oleoguttula sp. CCFEE 6159]
MNPRPAARLLSRRLSPHCLHARPRQPQLQASLLRTVQTTRQAPSSHRQSQKELLQALLEDEQQFREDSLGAPPPAAPHNPIDEITLQRIEAQRRAYYIRRSYYAAVGAAVCMLIPLLIIWNTDIPLGNKLVPKERADASNESNELFAGRPVHVIGTKVVAQDAKSGEEVELVDTGTSTIPHFPRTIHLPRDDDAGAAAAAGNAQDNEYTLLGLGVRSVSFLSIQVYVVGLYVRTADIATLQSRLIRTIDPVATTLVPAEKEKLRAALLDPTQGAEIWDAILRSKPGIRTAVRIMPTRKTDFNHLRDGWVRGMTARTQEAARRGETEYESEGFGAAMRDFKTLFGAKGAAPKGSVLVLTRDADGTLGAWFQEKEVAANQGQLVRLGSVRDERISRMVWMGYLAGKNVSSEGARRSVVDGCVEFVARPVGTVETMVT